MKELTLVGANNLKAVEDFPLLSEFLAIRNCEGLERVSNLPLVSELHVHGCPNLRYVDGLGSLQRLGLTEDMEEVSSHWLPELQSQHQQLHDGEDLDVLKYTGGR